MYAGNNEHYAVLIIGGARDGMIIVDDLTMDDAIVYAACIRCYDGEVAVAYDKSTDLILEV